MSQRQSNGGCLDRRTLAILAAGRCPIDQVDKLRRHLPHCPQCRGAIVASTGGRARGGDTIVMTPSQRALMDGEPPNLALRVGLLLLSLLSVAAAVWLTPAGASVRSLVERSLRPADAPGIPADVTPADATPLAPSTGVNLAPSPDIAR